MAVSREQSALSRQVSLNRINFAYAGLPGPLTLVNGIDSDYPSSIIGLLIGTAIALILPIVLIQVFGFGEQAAPVVAPESTATPVAKQEVSATLTSAQL